MSDVTHKHTCDIRIGCNCLYCGHAMEAFMRHGQLRYQLAIVCPACREVNYIGAQARVCAN